MSQLSQIRSVDPYLLRTVEGWNHALRAQRRLGYLQAPAWQRGDVATPIVFDQGVLFVFADTWIKTQRGRGLVRNSAVWVTHEGTVFWVKGEGADPALVTVDSDWWWPTGGIPAGNGAVLLFGSTWDIGSGQPYGLNTGNAVVKLDLNTNVMDTGEPVALSLPSDFAWGPPHRAGDTVEMAGFNAATWEHALASHLYSPDAKEYTDPWHGAPIQIEDAPLGPLSIRRWRRGWLATAKKLCSGPELSFDETPDLSAWYSTAGPEGPYRPLDPPLVVDTTRTDWRTYQGQAVELPHVGLVALWCANARWDLDTYDVDLYGPTFAEIQVPRVGAFKEWA